MKKPDEKISKKDERSHDGPANFELTRIFNLTYYSWHEHSWSSVLQTM